MVTIEIAGAIRVTFIPEFSRLGLIAVFVLVFRVTARANSQHNPNINHTNYTQLVPECFLSQTMRESAWLILIIH